MTSGEHPTSKASSGTSRCMHLHRTRIIEAHLHGGRKVTSYVSFHLRHVASVDMLYIMKTQRFVTESGSVTLEVGEPSGLLARMSPGERVEILRTTEECIILERASTGRTGRIVRESSKGFNVIKSFTF